MTSSNYPLAQPIEKVLIMLNKLVVNAEIHDGDTILYEGGQQTKVKLSKGESNTTD